MLLIIELFISKITMKKTSGLDSYLSKHGFKLSPVHSGKNEGYSSLSQRAAFASELKKYTHIKRILEIGFNAGHTSELFLKSCPKAEIVSFDLNYYPYTAVGAQYISSILKTGSPSLKATPATPSLPSKRRGNST